ncbi:MAG: DNA primase [Acutalibacteraceae bacterium]|nr:DNA primase [Acutalibacteraceae bacterium]
MVVVILALPEEFLQELKDRNDITDVVSSYVNLKRAGRLYSGRCPFHNEKTPSFYVYPDTQSFYCFGCGAGGEVITFIKKIENLDYIDAVKLLAQRAGMDMPQDSYDDSMAKLKRRIYEINRETARFFHNCLISPVGAKGLNYLRSRGLSNRTIKHFGLGYAPEQGFDLINDLRDKGFTDYEMIQANVAIKSKNGYTVSRFFDRVMYPIIDLRGNVIAFGGRIMSDQKPKYLNTSDTPVFSKSTQLFALNMAKNINTRQLILAEGYMDVIALHQAGFQNAVATLGTALTPQQADLIRRYADEVVICYDSDEAGRKASDRAIALLRNAGVKVRVVTVPNAKDPDEFMKSHGDKGPAMFKVLLERSAGDIDYKLDLLKEKHNISQSQGKVDYLNEAIKIIAQSTNAIERDIYITRLSEALDVQKSAIEQQMQKTVKIKNYQQAKREFHNITEDISARHDKINPEKSKHLKATKAEEYIIAFMINNPDMGQYINSKITTDDFATGFNKEVYRVISERLLSGKDVSLTSLSQKFNEEEISYITAYVSTVLPETLHKQALDQCLNVLKEEHRKIAVKSPDEMSDNDMLDYFKKMGSLKGGN